MLNIFKKYKNLWMLGIVAVLAILFIVNFSEVVNGFQAVWKSITGLLYGAMLAFILNLIMDPAEKLLKKTHNGFLTKHARPLAMFISILSALLIIILILSIVIPNLVSAFTVLAKEIPGYAKEIETFFDNLLKKYPQVHTFLTSININWKEVGDSIVKFLTKGFAGTDASGNAVSSTLNIFSSVVGGAVNTFVIIVFAIYVLSDKERFVHLYYFFTDLYLKPITAKRLTRNLRISNQSFKAFVGGEIIEACILTTMTIVGMLLLRLPYATMIGILVGVINMIPMVGAFIGGGIGAFIIFTVSPVKCLIFLIFLIIIQQIESNVFFPRVIGNRVGLPGIYVMMTIVVGGSLFGVFGMILGVPLIASIYKILKIYFEEVSRERHHSCSIASKTKGKGSGKANGKGNTNSSDTLGGLQGQISKARQSYSNNPEESGEQSKITEYGKLKSDENLENLPELSQAAEAKSANQISPITRDEEKGTDNHPHNLDQPFDTNSSFGIRTSVETKESGEEIFEEAKEHAEDEAIKITDMIMDLAFNEEEKPEE